MFSQWIGQFFSWARDGVARGLLRVHITPNALTCIGGAFTLVSAVAIAFGPKWWPAAAGLIILSGACDMLDGAVANLSGLGSRFGAVLDSFVDRAADFAIYLGAAVYFLREPGGPSIGHMALCWAAMANTNMVSYLGARGGEEGINARVGFWRRGERYVTLIIGLLAGHLLTALWILATWQALTVVQRLLVVRRGLSETGGDASANRKGFWAAIEGVILFNHPRGTLAFDIHAGLVIAILIFFPAPLIPWLTRLV